MIVHYLFNKLFHLLIKKLNNKNIKINSTIKKILCF